MNAPLQVLSVWFKKLSVEHIPAQNTKLYYTLSKNEWQ